MRPAIGLVAGALLLAGAVPAFAQSPGASADVKMPNGDSVGMASFTQETGGVRIKAQFKSLPVGDHGIHVHAVGKCDGPDFMTAGGHFNPTAKQHGLNNPQGAHGGDMLNLKVNPDGTGTVDYLLKDVSLAAGANSLFGPDGTALVIHAQADDEMTDPSGNSGARIACGTIARAGSTGTAAQAAPAAQPSPSPAAKPAAPVTAPAPAASPAAKPAAPAQAPAAAKPAAVASPAALPRTGAAPLPIDASIPAAIAGLGAMVAGLGLWRRRR